MKAKPTIFSCPMIRALLEGRKSQTRRILKPQPAHLQVYDWKGKRLHDSEYRHWCWNGNVGADSWGDITVQLGPFLPYTPGQLLWVRETWARAFELDGAGEPATAEQTYYRADGEPFDGYQMPDGTMRDGIPWRPSIHMPRWASRLTLEATEVRVQRVQDISEADARAEGVYRLDPTPEDEEWNRQWSDEHGHDPDPLKPVWLAPGVRQGWGMTKEERNRDQWWPEPIGAFRLLWNSIHGPGAWEKNPWVCAITFTAHHKNIDALLAERNAA